MRTALHALAAAVMRLGRNSDTPARVAIVADLYRVGEGMEPRHTPTPPTPAVADVMGRALALLELADLLAIQHAAAKASGAAAYAARLDKACQVAVTYADSAQARLREVLGLVDDVSPAEILAAVRLNPTPPPAPTPEQVRKAYTPPPAPSFGRRTGFRLEA